MNSELMAREYYYNYYKEKRPIGFNNFYNKYKKYFDNTDNMFGQRKEFSPEAFIHAILLEGFVYPQQLPIEKNWEIYERNKSSYKKENEDIILAKNIVSAYKNLKSGTVETFLNSPFNRLAIFNGKQSFPIDFFFFSKYFISFYKEHENDFKVKYNIQIGRVKYFQYKKIIEKIKEILGEDYYLK